MSRPEILYPLFADLTTLPGIGPKGAQALAQMKITTPRDLLFTLPHSGIDRSCVSSIREATLPATVTVEVTIGRHRPPAGRGPTRIEVEDARTGFQLVFLHARGDWLERMLPTGHRRIVSGKIELFDGIGQMAHPDYVLRPEERDQIPDFEPVYPLTAGLTQKTIAKSVSAAVDRAPKLPEWSDPGVMAREGWPNWRDALLLAHAPETDHDLSASAPAGPASSRRGSTMCCSACFAPTTLARNGWRTA